MPLYLFPLLLQAEPLSEALDPWALIWNATTVVKLVMLVLALMALGSWFISGMKLVRLAQARAASLKFLAIFWNKDEGNAWSGKRLEAIYAQIASLDASPLARVFRAGYVELAKITSGTRAPDKDDLDNVERSLKRAAANEMTQLEDLLPFLATTGSVGPFIGLFGTVWGIMSSFLAIGNQRNASLDVVAPGIAEALIATAIGLVAAIPAVMAYNYFVRRIRVLESETEAFVSDYLNIVRRHFLS
jgi:biopolymer transport protein TolQ